MKPNSGKCQLLITTEKSVSINIGRSNVKNKQQKLPGIKFDLSLFFEGHIAGLSSEQLYARIHTSENSQLHGPF